jgi:hypothetical protein
MIIKGQIGLKYGEAMAHLDPNRQLLAIKALRDNPDSNLVWFKAVAAKLYQQQLKESQTSLFSFDGIEAKTVEPEGQIIELPLDPSEYTPSFDPRNIVEDCRASIAIWSEAGKEWLRLGYGDKSKQCEAIVVTLEGVARVLPSIKPSNSIEAKILRIMDEGTAYTTGEIYRYANVSKMQAYPVLTSLVERGELFARRSGRGTRYYKDYN